MMKSDRCDCPHHGWTKLFRILIYVGVIGFFLTMTFMDSLFGWTSSHFFEAVIVLAALLFVMRGSCGCCCGDKHCTTCPVDTQKPTM